MNKTKLLVVDDSKQMKAFLKDLEKDPDFELLENVCDGDIALDKIKELCPDVVILDLLLPNKDGFCVLEDLNTLSQKPKVVVCSALSNPNFVQKAFSMGADNFVLKPCSYDGLKKTVLDSLNTKIEQFSLEKQNSVSKLLDRRISNIFITVGIPAHIKGYQFLREAIKMTIDTPDIINSITKSLYPNIARRFETSPSKVERAIRHAIEVAWNRGKIENINEVFGLPIYSANEKPTNGEFIALVADKMLIEC